jgi:hypothetical protein
MGFAFRHWLLSAYTDADEPERDAITFRVWELFGLNHTILIDV